MGDKNFARFSAQKVRKKWNFMRKIEPNPKGITIQKLPYVTEFSFLKTNETLAPCQDYLFVFCNGSSCIQIMRSLCPLG